MAGSEGGYHRDGSGAGVGVGEGGRVFCEVMKDLNVIWEG